MSMAGFRSETCVQCGKGFMDDCGDSFCSSSCERQWDDEHAECDNCGEECGLDNLNTFGLCEACEDEEDEED
jgi:hypothetical protein